MTGHYLEILSIQSPFAFGLDSHGRVMFSVNFQTISKGIDSLSAFEEDIIELFGGTIGMDTFVGPSALVPDGDGPYISFIDTSGSSLLETHNGGKYPRPSFQIIVRGLDYRSTREKAIDIWRSLDGIRDI